MKRLTLSVAAAALSLGSLGAIAAPAGASGHSTGQACQKTGMATVKSLGVFPAVAKSGIDAGTAKALGVRGIADVPDSTIFTLPQVLELHRTNPELFPWCD
ncbi:MAG: hypothetical protein ACKO2C_07665 [Actinomycetes bacterium]